MHETRLTILTNGLNYSQLAPHTITYTHAHIAQQIEALSTEINTFYFLIALIFETILSVVASELRSVSPLLLCYTSTLRESVEWVGLRSMLFGLTVITLGRHN